MGMTALWGAIASLSWRAGERDGQRVLVPDAREQAILADIRMRHQQGQSFTQIASALNVLGTAAQRGKWHAQHVARGVQIVPPRP